MLDLIEKLVALVEKMFMLVVMLVAVGVVTQKWKIYRS